MPKGKHINWAESCITVNGRIKARRFTINYNKVGRVGRVDPTSIPCAASSNCMPGNPHFGTRFSPPAD